LFQALGRTPLSEASPKKTLEGAAVGLSSAVTVAVVLAHWFQWPLSFTRFESSPSDVTSIVSAD